MSCPPETGGQVQGRWIKGGPNSGPPLEENKIVSINRHVSENHKRKILLKQPGDLPGCSMTYFIDEAGFYELVFSSKLPTAKLFREWVFTKVLPLMIKILS